METWGPPIVVAIIALAGVLLSRRSEHQRWLRQERLAAWTTIAVLADEVLRASSDESAADRLDELRVAVHRCMLLGPNLMITTAILVHERARAAGEDQEARTVAWRALMEFNLRAASELGARRGLSKLYRSVMRKIPGQIDPLE